MPTLEDTLTLANNVLAALSNLIDGAGGSTPVPGDSETPLPTYDEVNDEWTVTQDTADSNGIYKGIYAFALDTACSQLTIQSVTGHTIPANTSFPPARYTDCNDVVHDLSSVNDLSGKQVKRFEILSDTAFTVTLTITVTWEHTFDFTQDDGGWSVQNGWGDGWQSGVGFQSEYLSTGVGPKEMLYITRSFPATIITYFEFSSVGTGAFTNPPANDAYLSARYDLGASGVEVYRVVADGQTITGTRVVYDDPVGVSADKLSIQNNPFESGDWWIVSIKVKGIGANPFI